MILDINGNNNEKVFLYAYLNAIYETGFENPIDKSIKDYKRLDVSSDYSKIDEIPYDFIRKRLSIAVLHKDNSLPTNSESRNILITKGALPNVLDICSFVELTDGKIEDIYKLKDKIKDSFKEFGDKGYRVIGIAYKLIEKEMKPTRQLSSNASQNSINGSSTNTYLIDTLLLTNVSAKLKAG